MFWSEEEKPHEYQTPDKVVDLSFKLTCKQIKLDHAWSLTNAISDRLPWFKGEPQCAIHHIYIPQSGNGWIRDDDFKDEIIQLSRRTRLKLRVPKHRISDVRMLSGQTISVDGFNLTFGQADEQLLSTLTTLVARHVYVPDTDHDEQAFLMSIHQQVQDMGIDVRKMLCGKSHRLSTSDGQITTRSLMVADISPEDSICLQENGVGDYYSYGCGVFIPQKGITAVNTE